MTEQSLLARYDIFFASATMTAHANGFVDGFRQRDVRFFIELFTNFVDPSSAWEGLPIQNTHISRYLKKLVSEGMARKVSKKGHPVYKLNRVGLVELVGAVVKKTHYHDLSHFFFVHSFVENYSPRLMNMVKREGEKFPYALKLELEQMFNLQGLRDSQLDFTRKELLSLEKRIAQQEQTKELCEKLLAEGMEFSEMIKEVEKHYPYSMNTTKPLAELMSEGTPKQAIWELTIGGPRRSDQLWKPARERLMLHIKQLEQLAEQSDKR